MNISPFFHLCIALFIAACGDDKRSAGTVIVTPATGLETTESGGQATFSISLGKIPQSDVSLTLVSSNTAEGVVSPATLTFTQDNYNAPQVVTITGVEDALVDGVKAYQVLTDVLVSDDRAYEALDPADINVENADNESGGVTVTPVSGRVTTEQGGQATFDVVLNSKPAAAVRINLTSSDVTEGTIGSGLVFTTDSWNAPQTVTITGVDDEISDGPQLYTIITSATVSLDAAYDGLAVADVSVSNTDDESPGVTVTPTVGLVTTESGNQVTFSIVLNSEPTSNVTIALTSNDPTEGIADRTSLVFTPVNWKAPQETTVTGQDDNLVDGDQVYYIVTGVATSSDGNYNGIEPDDVIVTNTDNESAGITVNPVVGLTTSEAGAQATFTIVLNSPPTADVTIGLTSSDISEGTVGPTTVTFTAVNWNALQTVTVTGVDDPMADGNQSYTIVTAPAVSGDAGYANRDAGNVAVTNTDDETSNAGITVTPSVGLTTTEAGAQATFTIVLNSQPTADVTIGLTSNDTTEGTVGPAGVTFTASNWFAPQTVTITGIDDAFADGNQPYVIVTGPATSADPAYASRDAANASVANLDNDTVGITVSPIIGLMTTEAGGQATFSIVLNSHPIADVTIDLVSSDTTEGTVAPASVVFTSLNWNTARTITVTGVNDALNDGNQPYAIVTAPATSADPSYSTLNASDVSVINVGPSAGAGGYPVNLRTAGDFGVLAKTGITGTGASVKGDLGLSPATSGAIVGFALTPDASMTFSTSAQVIGKLYAFDHAAPTPAKLMTAHSDLALAITDASGRTPTFIGGAGALGGMSISPGVYQWSSVAITTDVTLMGTGSGSDVWIFQISTTLDMTAAMRVVLAGGAQAKNVFWQVTGAVTLGASATLEGVILASAAFTSGAGTTINGRVLGQAAATLTNSILVQPAP